MTNQCPRCLCTPHVGPCAGFYPGWAEHHVPAKGSQRPYSGLQHDHTDEMSSAPLTPATRLSARVHDDARATAKLERLAR